jgi:hypothetical protein
MLGIQSSACCWSKPSKAGGIGALRLSVQVTVIARVGAVTTAPDVESGWKQTWSASQRANTMSAAPIEARELFPTKGA